MHNENTLEHLHRYAIACEFIKDKVVLDLASGEGYGTNLMSKYATNIIGIVYSETTINHAISKYRKGNLRFVCASAVNTTLENHSVDVVVLYQLTIR